MRKRIAITGLGLVSPIGNDISSSWDSCLKGASGTDKITRFDPSVLRSQIAGEVKGFQLPDILSKKEARKMDLFTHYAFGATYEALNNAGLTIDEELQHHIGVSLGVGIGGQPTIEKYFDILQKSGPEKISPFFLPMALANMVAGQISMFFKTRGYNACTVSACASSSHAIGDAARLIERGDAKVMIAGGTESAVTPLCLAGFSAMRALTERNHDPKRASRPYDRERDGFVFSEGSGILILEDWEFAKARGANIYCELAGYGFSSDAHHLTAPSIDGPVQAMRMALKDAEVNPENVDYINAHGTSTPIGDLNELQAFKKVLGSDASKKVSVSSTKSMTGHLLGAAGATEAVLTVKALENNFVPPTINIDELDPECDIDVTPNQGKERQIDKAFSTSFGFGGTNACLVFKSA